MVYPQVQLLSTQVLTEGRGAQTAFFANEKYIAIALDDYSVHVLNHKTPIRKFNLSDDCVWAVAIVEDATFTGHEAGISRLKVVARTPSHGERLISSSDDGVMCIWSLETYQCLHTLKASESPVYGLAAGEKWVATGAGEEKIKIWDKEYGHLIADIEAHSPVVDGLRVYNDQLVSTGTDGLVKIWSMASYELLQSVKMHDHAVTTRDLLGGVIVTGGKDGGYEEDVCGLEGEYGEEGDEDIKDIGSPVIVIWDLACVGNRIVVSSLKRGKPTVEVWEVEDMLTQTRSPG
ncbi:hypothetical protein MMC30_006352 [Trapelia coarctata]|nr:hypothetical protein [Trapelia coarctata]